MPLPKLCWHLTLAFEHIKWQHENSQALHVGTIRCQQQQGSQFYAHTFTLGGELVRSDTHTEFTEEGAYCMLNGIYHVQNQQHVDHHTCIEHQKPHGTSRQRYKGVLNGKSRAVFNGKIIASKDAIKTDAQQTNVNCYCLKKLKLTPNHS